MPGLWGLLALLFAASTGAQTRSAPPILTPIAPSAGLPAPGADTAGSSLLPAASPNVVLAPTLTPVPSLAANAIPSAQALALPASPRAGPVATSQGPVAGAVAPRGPPSKAPVQALNETNSGKTDSALAAPLPESLKDPNGKASAAALKSEADSDWALRTGEPRAKLNVLVVGAESVPYAKTGGLADVVDAVSRGLAKRGHKVTLILPKYLQLDAEKHNFRRTDIEVKVPIGEHIETARLWAGQRGGVDVYLLENDPLHSPNGYYAPRKPGYSDDDERFIFLARGALEAAKALGLKPDIVHTHDWHSALIAPMLKLLYNSDPSFAATKSVLTLHNMAYQGMFPFAALLKAGFDPKDFTPDKLEYWGQFNFLKAGLAFADALTTVSPTYAREIQGSNEFGRGMEGLLRFRAADLHGILNGIDPELWDPGTDRQIVRLYTEADVTRGKAANKEALQKEAGLAIDPKAPLFAIASRFDHQKGLDLAAEAIPGLVAKGAQVVILGSGDPALQANFEELARRYPGQVYLHPFSETFVHKVYAAADFMLMPSRFEPCGLTQLISQHYGTLPIVARTGGLADTITDIDDDPRKGDGFFLKDFSAQGILDASDRALSLMARPQALHRSRLTAMKKDSSWSRALEQYERLFMRLLAEGRLANFDADPDKEYRVLTESPSVNSPARDEVDAEQESETSFEIDPALVQSTFDGPDGLMREEPYVIHFRKGKLNLYYVSANHEGNPASSTHKLIDRIFAKYPIQRVILEGRRNKDGDLSAEEVKRVIAKKQKGYWSEGDHALEHAAKRGLRSIGGEPADKDVLAEMLAAGYEPQDLLGMYFIRMIPSYRSRGRIEKESLEKLFNEDMRWNRQEVGVGDEPAFSYQDFLAWYRARQDEDFDPAKVGGGYAPKADGNFLERLSDAVSNVRNRFLAGVISRELREKKDVLVVYGNGHHSAQRRALEAAMGKPVYEGTLQKDKAP